MKTLFRYFSDALDYIWTGLMWSVSEQKFKWCGATTSSYRNWCTGEPQVDPANNKLCVAMKVDRVSGGSSIARGCLKVFDCSTELAYLCHRRCSNYAFMDNAVNSINDALQL